MAARTWMQCDQAQGFDQVTILTDSTLIHLEMLKYGCECIVQDVQATNGTERIAYYVRDRYDESDLVINVQGDEPLMDPGIPQRLLFNLENKPGFVWTAVRPVRRGELEAADVTKCRECNGFVNDWEREGKSWHNSVQIGVYGYTVGRLLEYLDRPQTDEEKRLGLEQLRWNEPLACITCDYRGIGVDRPEDIAKVEERLS
jgi:3-deoxy-manno-octulosonate cytidylyltransferase (CMP-KDO synthetase)